VQDKKLTIKRKRGRKKRKPEKKRDLFLTTCNQLTECKGSDTYIYNNYMNIKIKIEVMSVGRIKTVDFETCESLIKR